MSEKAKKIGAGLFWFQVVCAIIFGYAQAERMFHSTQGVSIAFFVFHGLFALFNLSMASVALAQADSDKGIKKQSVLIYLMWTVVLVIHLSIALWQIDNRWNNIDSLASLIVIAGVVGVLIISKLQQWSIWPMMDPYVKAGLAIVCKSVPQVLLAVNISIYGSAGLSGVWILVGHITICTRLAHLVISNHERWDRNTKGSLISEVWNELSWIAATSAWLYF